MIMIKLVISLNFVENIGNLVQSSKTDQKRALLKLMLSNSTIIDKKAWISLKKPFDLLKNSNGRTSWLCSVCNSRAELLEIGREIEELKFIL